MDWRGAGVRGSCSCCRRLKATLRKLSPLPANEAWAILIGVAAARYILLILLSAAIYSRKCRFPALLDDADASHAMVSHEMLQRHDGVILYMNGISEIYRGGQSIRSAPLRLQSELLVRRKWRCSTCCNNATPAQYATAVGILAQNVFRMLSPRQQNQITKLIGCHISKE